MKNIFSILIFLNFQFLFAQLKTYTLEECVSIALEKNISIQQSEFDLDGADIDRFFKSSPRWSGDDEAPPPPPFRPCPQ